jgi:hypothetical protein
MSIRINVGRKLARLPDGFLAVLGLAAYFPAALGLKDLPKHGSNTLVVIGHEDAQWAHAPSVREIGAGPLQKY